MSKMSEAVVADLSIMQEQQFQKNVKQALQQGKMQWIANELKKYRYSDIAVAIVYNEFVDMNLQEGFLRLMHLAIENASSAALKKILFSPMERSINNTQSQLDLATSVLKRIIKENASTAVIDEFFSQLKNIKGEMLYLFTKFSYWSQIRIEKNGEAVIASLKEIYLFRRSKIIAQVMGAAQDQKDSEVPVHLLDHLSLLHAVTKLWSRTVAEQLVKEKNLDSLGEPFEVTNEKHLDYFQQSFPDALEQLTSTALKEFTKQFDENHPAGKFIIINVRCFIVVSLAQEISVLRAQKREVNQHIADMNEHYRMICDAIKTLPNHPNTAAYFKRFCDIGADLLMITGCVLGGAGYLHQIKMHFMTASNVASGSVSDNPAIDLMVKIYIDRIIADGKPDETKEEHAQIILRKANFF